MKKIQAILLTGLMVLAMTISTSTSASAQNAASTRAASVKVQPPQKLPAQCGSSSERVCLPTPRLSILQVVGVIVSLAGGVLP